MGLRTEQAQGLLPDNLIAGRSIRHMGFSYT
jgi:hypothetical protein